MKTEAAGGGPNDWRPLADINIAPIFIMIAIIKSSEKSVGAKCCNN